jgi:hypothetical protein
MKTLAALLLLATTTAFAEPAKKVTNREFPDGTWSSKEMDRDKRRSIERFYTAGSKIPYQTILYQLDDRFQPASGIYYNSKNVVFQKCTYKLDGADRISQEVIYDAKGTLMSTNNYIYGTRGGQSTLIGVDRYDANGNLIPKAKVTGRKR